MQLASDYTSIKRKIFIENTTQAMYKVEICTKETGWLTMTDD